uniref:Uncharacterized protein n=1 Tax=Rhizophora mucronata TaxID=61149 RepID=A0A2P2PD66_RHIMU
MSSHILYRVGSGNNSIIFFVAAYILPSNAKSLHWK